MKRPPSGRWQWKVRLRCPSCTVLMWREHKNERGRASLPSQVLSSGDMPNVTTTRSEKLQIYHVTSVHKKERKQRRAGKYGPWSCHPIIVSTTLLDMHSKQSFLEKQWQRKKVWKLPSPGTCGLQPTSWVEGFEEASHRLDSTQVSSSLLTQNTRRFSDPD